MKHDGSALATSIPRMALSLHKVAIALDLSPNTVLRLVEEGALPRPRRVGRRRLWRVAEIDAAIAEWPTDGEEAGIGTDGGDDDRWSAD